MLQFANEPTVLTHIELSYLSLEDKIGFMMLTDDDLHKVEGFAKLTPQEIRKFRQTIKLSLESDYQKLLENNVRIIYQLDDNIPMILARTIAEQQRERDALLKNPLNPEDSLENLIELNAQLNTINMEMVIPRLPDVSESRIDLNVLGLTRLPEALIAKLREYPELAALDVSGNALTSLPESFGSLRGLEDLYLKDNLLPTLPNSFGSLVALNILDLSHNNLITLPKSFGNLTELFSLNLSNNNLFIWPEPLGSLTRLLSLDLRNNHLINVSKSFGRLMAIEALNLQNNSIITLPEILGNLGSLRCIYLNGNPLLTLPKSLRILLSKTKHANLIPLLAIEQPLLPTPYFFKIFNEFTTREQGKNISNKINSLNFLQLTQLSAAITRKMSGAALNDQEKQILTILTPDEGLRNHFIIKCIKDHGNLFLEKYMPPNHFNGNFNALSQYFFGKIVDSFYPLIKVQADRRLRAIRPLLVAPRKMQPKTAFFKSKKTSVYTPSRTKVEKRESASEISWLTLQAMVEDVAALQRSLPLKDKFADIDSINALREVRDFLNNYRDDFEGLRALLTHDSSDEMMGIGSAVKVFKEPGISKLYTDLFRALQDAPVRESVKKRRIQAR